MKEVNIIRSKCKTIDFTYQATNANYTDSDTGSNVVASQRRPDCQTGAKHRSSVLGFDSIGDGEDVSFVSAYHGGIATLRSYAIGVCASLVLSIVSLYRFLRQHIKSTHICWYFLLAIVLVPGLTSAASVTRCNLSTTTYSASDFDTLVLNFGANAGGNPHDLMSILLLAIFAETKGERKNEPGNDRRFKVTPSSCYCVEI